MERVYDFQDEMTSLSERNKKPMTEEQLHTLKRRLYNRIPLIGRWLRRGAAEALTQDGSPEAVRVLAEAVTRTHDRQVVDITLTAYRQLTNQECLNQVCTVWAETRHQELAEVIIEHGWIASTPVKIKVLSAMKTGKMDTVVGDGAAVIKSLVEACHDADEEIRFNAAKCLRHLHHQKAREALCQYSIEHDDPVVHEIVKAAQYAPRNPAQRALFYFLTEQWDKYEHLDFDQRLLKTLYPHIDAQIRKRLAVCARKAGRVEWVEVVVGSRQKKPLAEMTDEDWEVTLSLLNTHQDWQAIWRLAQIAPAIWSVRLLNRLIDVQWTQAHNVEQTVFEHISGLAIHCQSKHIKKLHHFVRCSALLQGDMGRVRCLAISPDGRLLASGGGIYDNTIRLWRLPDGKAVRTLKGHTDRIICFAMSPDSRLLASGSYGVWLWRLPEGEAVRSLHGHNYSVGCLAISPDSRLLACGSDRVRLWQVPEGKAIQTMHDHTGRVDCLAISPDGRLLASGGKAATVRLWRLPDGKAVRTLKGHTERITCFAMSPDGRLLASGSEDHTVRLWRLPEGRAVGTLKGHTDHVTCFAMSSDGRVLASGSKDHTVRLWRLPEGRAVKTLWGRTQKVTCVAMSPDGRLLASGSEDHTVWLWRLPEGEAVQKLTGHTQAVTCIAMSPDGRVLVSGSLDRTLRVWRSELERLTSVPVSLTTQQDIEWLLKTLQEPDITAGEQAWLELMLELIHCQRRYDIELGEAPKHIPAGEFDIEIASPPTL